MKSLSEFEEFCKSNKVWGDIRLIIPDDCREPYWKARVKTKDKQTRWSNGSDLARVLGRVSLRHSRLKTETDE